MENFVLSTDTCCDEFKTILKAKNISYIPMTFICDETVLKDNYDSAEEYLDFYKSLKQGKRYSTSGLNPLEIEEYFVSLLKTAKKDIVHICLSSGLSLTYNVTKSVADELNRTHDNKIYVIDSLSATQGQNILLNIAKDMQNDGKFAMEVYNKLTELVNSLNVSFFVADFDCLKRGGRVSGLQAMLGKVMNLKPYLEFDEEGKLKVLGKVLGYKKAINTLVERFNKFYDNESAYPVYIAFTDNLTIVEELKSKLLETHPSLNVVAKSIGPVIGTHTGSDALGLVFIGTKR